MKPQHLIPSGIQMSESLFVGLLLASVGGFLESYSFISRDGVFANCQTGNIVLMAMYLSWGDVLRALSYFIPVLSFFIGVVLTELVRSCTQDAKLHWRQYVILIETAILAGVGLIPSGPSDTTATTLIAFSCSMQVESFRKIKGFVCATTMCTGNLRSGTSAFFQYLRNREQSALKQAGYYFSVIAAFMAGVGSGCVCTHRYGARAVWLACVILLLVFFLLFIRPQEK